MNSAEQPPLTRATWWGHASVTVEDSGTRLITDPLLVARVAHLRRRVAAAHPDVFRADAALISHLHMDHLHVGSLAALPPDALLVVPKGARPLLRRLGLRRVVEVEPGQTLSIGAVEVDVVAAAHDGHRGPWSRLEGPAMGFVVRGQAVTYFAGDTDLCPTMDELPDLDLALLPVGGWGPGLGEGHLDPHRAAQSLLRLRTRVAVPVHWGSYWPIGMTRVRGHELRDPGHLFAAEAAELAPGVDVQVLPPGGAVDLALQP